ncbi:hypothetical protein [Blastomonas sp. AAP53]|uniref:hypothetical protein n=1 Tax=Blastomonas sp. AAP53 TaxID=1248760 RepID=UPI0012676B5D|nr:hypothetical protein [Blastomonas sp. AAP53]
MTEAQHKSANGECPMCGTPISFFRANFKRGQPFACNACGKRLLAGKSSVRPAVAAFALASYLGKEFGFLAVIPVAMLLVVYEWLTVRVTIAAHEQTAIDA